MRSLSLFIFSVFCQFLIAENSDFMVVEVYVDQYKKAAIAEMHRTGIPASIKLAQGILESDAGRSELATEANNHFGMKCGGHWEGPTYFKKDDDRDRKGRLIKSCFRVFNSPSESYVEHSNFLMDPRKEYRYGFLFNIDRTDYKSWAWGLKKAGYATNKRYAVLLIDIIEEYGLYTYDYHAPKNIRYVNPGLEIAKGRENVRSTSTLTKQLSTVRVEVPVDELVEKASDAFHSEKRVSQINSLDYVMALNGETIEDIARIYELDSERLVKYNDWVYSKGQKLNKGDRVFLEAKRRSFNGPSHYHTVRKGETLFSISQNYGVKVNALRSRNKLESKEEPVQGQRVKLQGKAVSIEEIMVSKGQNRKEEVVHQVGVSNKEVEANGKNSSQTKTQQGAKIPSSDQGILKNSNSVGSVIPADENIILYHLVSKGDTLYSLGKKYGLTSDQIKELNGLESDSITLGSKLRVK